MGNRILVVDDERQMAAAMQRTLERCGHAVDVACGAEQALSAMARDRFDLVFTDLRMPGVDGQELLGRIRAQYPTVRVVLVTAYGTVRSAVDCVKQGADDYLLKPFSPEALREAAAQALGEHRPLRPDEMPRLIAEDPATIAALDTARRAARSDATVLLEAESGAGKEVFAGVIHRESPRAGGPFVALNCASLPRELLEAELFGHVRGAFTGALRDRRGHFQMAHGGTLLLDEVGEMSGDLQARLLRVLQERTIQPVGSENHLSVDVRVIAATNRNLREEVREGRFREDLYYRLRVLPIRIPPLRERPGDIEPLAVAFVRRFSGPRARLTDEARNKLSRHTWPGNVRELQNALQRASILAPDFTIDAGHLDLEPALASEPPATSLDDAEREAIRRTLETTGGNRTAAAARLGISPRTLRHKLKRYRDEGRPIGGAS